MGSGLLIAQPAELVATGTFSYEDFYGVLPPVKTLILPPSQNWSHGKTLTMNSPFDTEEYPESNGTDGSMATLIRSSATGDSFLIDLGQARTPNLFGVFNHNLDTGLSMTVRASSDPSMSPLLLSTLMTARFPNCWLDLQNEAVSARYWQLVVSGNSKALSIGEIVVGTAFLFVGILTSGYKESIKFWQERNLTEYGKVNLSASGSLTRRLTINLVMFADDLANLSQIWAEAGAADHRVVMVPDALRNDIWFLDWPATKSVSYPVSEQAQIGVALDVVEESGGVV